MMYALRMTLRQAQQLVVKTSYCRGFTFIESLDKDDLAVFNEWIKDKKPAGFIARVVKADGRFLHEKTMKRHLDGQCHCPDKTKFKGVYNVSA